MRTIILVLMLFIADSLHAGDTLMQVVATNFQSHTLTRCLNYYVANFSTHATNHFYVGAVEVDRGQLMRALVYWKEEQEILDYGELNADAPKGTEIEAWHYPPLKLGRDTVDKPEDIAGSTYLVTRHDWMEWRDQCISRGRLYRVLLSDARRSIPNTK